MIELFIETVKEIESICIIHSRFPFLQFMNLSNLMESYQYIRSNWIDQTSSRSRVKQFKTTLLPVARQMYQSQPLTVR